MSPGRFLRPHPVRAVVIEGFTTRLGFGMVTFALPLYARHLGMSLTQLGVLIAAKALMEPAVKPLMGEIVDRWGARRGYLAAVSARLVASVLLFNATSPASLYAVRLAQGAASAARDPASISVIAASTERRLGRAFSLSFGAKDLGTVSAGAVGGFLLAGTGDNFRLLWAAVVVLSVLPVLVVWLWVPPPSDQVKACAAVIEDVPGAEPPQPRVLRDRRLRLLCTLGLLAGAVAHMTSGLFPVLASEVGGMTPGQIGAAYSVSVLVLLLVGPLAGLAADRFGAAPLTGVRGIANTLSSLLYLLFPTAAGIIAARMVDDAGRAAFRPPWGSLLAEAARNAGSRGGRVAATLDTALSIGEVCGPVLATLLWDLWGLAAFLLVRAGLGIATELFITRRLRRTS
jgi:MFS family permease